MIIKHRHSLGKFVNGVEYGSNNLAGAATPVFIDDLFQAKWRLFPLAEIRRANDPTPIGSPDDGNPGKPDAQTRR